MSARTGPAKLGVALAFGQMGQALRCCIKAGQISFLRREEPIESRHARVISGDGNEIGIVQRTVEPRVVAGIAIPFAALDLQVTIFEAAEFLLFELAHLVNWNTALIEQLEPFPRFQ